MIPQTKEEFCKMLDTNKDTLYSMIKANKIPFELCQHVITTSNLYSSLDATVLCHPKCTTSLFKKKFRDIPGLSPNHFMVLRESIVMSSLSNIQFVLSLSDRADIPRLVSIWNEEDKDNSINSRLHDILLNPHCNDELKSKIYESTGDINFLPKDAAEIFIF